MSDTPNKRPLRYAEAFKREAAREGRRRAATRDEEAEAPVAKAAIRQPEEG